MVSKRLPKYLRKRRTDAGLTLRQLSAKTKIPHNTLAQIERGILKLSVNRLEQIARAYKETVTQFMAPLDGKVSV